MWEYNHAHVSLVLLFIMLLMCTDDLLSDPYSPSSVDLANELNTSGTSCDLTHSLSNIGGMTGPRDYEPAAAPVSFRAPSNAFSSNSTPFSSNSTVFSSNSTPFSSNSTVSKPMSYVQPMLNAMPHCPNNVSASSVFDQGTWKYISFVKRKCVCAVLEGATCIV